MNCNTIYRISKYDPAFRINGVYTRDEWTDYGCIGKKFSGERLKRAEYVKIENRYLSTLCDVLEYLSITEMTKGEMEWHRTFYRAIKRAPSTNQRIGIIRFAKGCLRNKYWAQLQHDNLRIHFAWDYYMELGCDMSVLPSNKMCQIVRKNNLHCQIFKYDAKLDIYYESGSI